MKILVVASLTEAGTANYLIRALLDDGHILYVCSDLASPLVDQLTPGQIDVGAVCEEQQFTPDLFLFIEGGSMRLFPTGLERLNCLTAWYGIDSHMDYAKHVRIGRLFDVTFIAQKEFVNKMREDGLRQVYWLPLAFAPELHPEENVERSYNIAYVGSNNAIMHPVRHALLNRISKEFANVYMGMLSPVEMGRVYAQARMVFNKSVNNDVNMRYFEAMGAGAVLLTDHAEKNGVEELFTEGDHYLEYQDEDSLIALIKELSLNSARCQRIGETARQHILANHTYAHRVSDLLGKANQSEKLVKPTAEGYFSVFIALLLPLQALRAVKQAFDWPKASMAQRFVSGIVRAGLMLLIQCVQVIEWGRDRARSIK